MAVTCYRMHRKPEGSLAIPATDREQPWRYDMDVAKGKGQGPGKERTDRRKRHG